MPTCTVGRYTLGIINDNSTALVSRVCALTERRQWSSGEEAYVRANSTEDESRVINRHREIQTPQLGSQTGTET